MWVVGCSGCLCMPGGGERVRQVRREEGFYRERGMDGNGVFREGGAVGNKGGGGLEGWTEEWVDIELGDPVMRYGQSLSCVDGARWG